MEAGASRLGKPCVVGHEDAGHEEGSPGQADEEEAGRDGPGKRTAGAPGASDGHVEATGTGPQGQHQQQ